MDDSTQSTVTSTVASSAPSVHAAADARFQRRDWRAQRVARGCFCVVVLAALSGVFGNGPLSRTSREASWGTIHYDRFLRAHSRIVIDVRPALASAQPDAGSNANSTREANATIDLGEFFRADDELVFVPPPIEEGMSGRNRWIRVRTPTSPTTIAIHWKPHRAGLRQGSLRIDDDAIHLWSFVYP